MDMAAAGAAEGVAHIQVSARLPVRCPEGVLCIRHIGAAVVAMLAAAPDRGCARLQQLQGHGIQLLAGLLAGQLQGIQRLAVAALSARLHMAADGDALLRSQDRKVALVQQIRPAGLLGMGDRKRQHQQHQDQGDPFLFHGDSSSFSVSIHYTKDPRPAQAQRMQVSITFGKPHQPSIFTSSAPV